jgi:hypothetical protein
MIPPELGMPCILMQHMVVGEVITNTLTHIQKYINTNTLSLPHSSTSVRWGAATYPRRRNRRRRRILSSLLDPVRRKL